MNESKLAFARDGAALSLLDRHSRRRGQNVPTLSVVVGRGEAPARLVRHWLRQERCDVCESRNVQLRELFSDWFAYLAAERDLPGEAYVWLAARTGQGADELRSRLRDRATEERGLYFDRTLGATANSPAEIACRATVEHDCEQGSTATELCERLLAACRDDARVLFVGAAAIVGQSRLPGLFVNLPPGAMPAEVAAACENSAALAILATEMNVLLAISVEQVETYLAAARESRLLALVREGLIRLEMSCELGGAALVACPAPAGSGAGEPTTAFGNAACPAMNDDDPARSHAERYLFERLQAHPETANLFELNGLLAVDGDWNGSLEVDLLARSVRVAVEIDGFFHFQDLEAYRRDRRKDVLLQRGGYFVVRCLADDVVSRLEEIMHTIVTAVRQRHAQSMPS